ncbi:MAG: hypothetical protein ABI039_11270 [Vicinamibacterales bacterium]
MDSLTCPQWVHALLAGEPRGRYRLTTRQIEHATTLNEEGLAAAVDELYRRLIDDLQHHHRYALRMWNFIPDIQAQMDTGDRYMAFNAGRHRAFTERFGNDRGFIASLPTASGVGVAGTTLTVHLLDGDQPGVPIENPRQVAAYRYSERFGKRPPCFARALHAGSLLLIGGTASIAGEDSRHTDDPEAQTEETLANLAALVITADADSPAQPLHALRDVRVHVARRGDVPLVRQTLVPQLHPDAVVEFVVAALCRPELLVEIEGVAAVAAAVSSGRSAAPH